MQPAFLEQRQQYQVVLAARSSLLSFFRPQLFNSHSRGLHRPLSSSQQPVFDCYGNSWCASLLSNFHKFGASFLKQLPIASANIVPSIRESKISAQRNRLHAKNQTRIGRQIGFGSQLSRCFKHGVRASGKIINKLSLNPAEWKRRSQYIERSKRGL